MPTGLWDSGLHNSGFTFFHTFPTAGSFSYYCTVHGACCGMIGTVNVGTAAASPTPIPKGSVRVQLKAAATGLTAPGSLVSSPDESSRLFVVQQIGKILILKNSIVGATPFLNVSSRLVSLDPSYDERGLLGFAFHPDFNNAGTAGFHKVYTYTSEPVAGSADFTVPDTSPFDHQSVVAEWQISTSNPDVVDPSTRREVMRIDEPQANHNGGQLAFRPSDRYLYISLGDGGAANDVGAGHNASTGNAQDKSTVLGKILRIDPLDPALTTSSADAVSTNGKYRVPNTNPFVGQTGTVAEIYDLGLRNPYRFSFDATADQLVIGDVGQNNVEEIDIGVPGKNYGWNKKEGSYRFNPSDGSIAQDAAPDPSLTEPLAEYSHTDGSAVIGGFVYRGTSLPALVGKYVFGDLALSMSGRLFYTDLTDGAIKELRLGAQDMPLGLFLKGFGRDANGELYALVDSNIGPSGTGGEVLKIDLGELTKADFNDDGKSDILWQDNSGGDRAIWLMNATVHTGTVDLGSVPLEWKIVGTGNFNGDNKTDIVWQNASTGTYAIWFMDGTSHIFADGIAFQWQIASTGDFNGDSTTDIVWQNTATGERAIWFMNNAASYSSSISLGVVPTEWRIAGTGDFNGDGKTDIVWQNGSTGAWGIWFMNGASYVGGVEFGPVPLQWQIAGTGNFNGDNNTDIVWQNTSTGERAIWLMNGSTHAGTASLGVAPVHWEIRNH
jgi:glucose/arabinose dehydrogenase